MKIGNNKYLLDTNIIIDLFKGNQGIADNFDRADVIFLPIHALGELFLGAEISERRQHHFAQISNLLNIVQIINTSEETAKLYGSIKAFLKQKGRPIPENDIWIGALAREHNLPIVTRDRHFQPIPAINFVDW